MEGAASFLGASLPGAVSDGTGGVAADPAAAGATSAALSTSASISSSAIVGMDTLLVQRRNLIFGTAGASVVAAASEAAFAAASKASLADDLNTALALLRSSGTLLASAPFAFTFTFVFAALVGPSRSSMAVIPPTIVAAPAVA